MKFSAGSRVTGISVTAPGDGFTARPTATVADAPAGGVRATATAVGKIIQVAIATLGNGTGYTLNDILTVVGGTGTAATIKVTGVSTGAITLVELVTAGAYTVLPTLSENEVTGGTGTGAKMNLTIGLGPITLTNAGRGYTSVPAVTIGGAGGSGASAAASMDEDNYDISFAQTTSVVTSQVLGQTYQGLPVDFKVWGEA